MTGLQEAKASLAKAQAAVDGVLGDAMTAVAKARSRVDRLASSPFLVCFSMLITCTVPEELAIGMEVNAGGTDLDLVLLPEYAGSPQESNKSFWMPPT